MAGQALLVATDSPIDESLRLEPSPGHTPGPSVSGCGRQPPRRSSRTIWMHRTVQAAEPQWSSRFFHDPARARATRREFGERQADSGILVLAVDFPRPGYILRTRDEHRFEPWRPS